MLTDEAKQFAGLTSYHTYNTEGIKLWEKPAETGCIRGRTFSNGRLPGYLINMGGVKAMIIAQNPNKDSKSAEKAKQGAKIAWIIRCDGENNKYLGKIENGVYHEPEGEYGWKAVALS